VTRCGGGGVSEVERRSIVRWRDPSVHRLRVAVRALSGVVSGVMARDHALAIGGEPAHGSQAEL